MLSTSYFWNLSRKIYKHRNFREDKRAFVFFCKACANKGLFQELYDYFDDYTPKKTGTSRKS